MRYITNVYNPETKSDDHYLIIDINNEQLDLINSRFQQAQQLYYQDARLATIRYYDERASLEGRITIHDPDSLEHLDWFTEELEDELWENQFVRMNPEWELPTSGVSYSELEMIINKTMISWRFFPKSTFIDLQTDWLTQEELNQ